MIKITFIIILLIVFNNCSFTENSKIWNDDKKEINQSQNLTKVFSKKKPISKEFNPSVKIDLKNISSNENKNFNYFGSQKYKGQFNKIKSFKFSKLEKFNSLDVKPLILSDALLFFDKKGSLIKYNQNSKILWKKNFYSKNEKKLNPNLSIATKNDKLIIADNISKFYSVDLNSGKLIWSQNNQYPFNSEIKIYEDKFFVIDYNSTLRCFNIDDGSECWNLNTESSLTIPNSKYSLVIINDLIIFNNSVGDITAVDASTGTIIWQLPTQSRSSINQTYNYENSKLVTDGKSLFFSNNKNEFYSIDIDSGSINWNNNINSNLTPIILDKFLFTVSNGGYLFVIDKNTGNILRINDVYNIYKEKNKKNIEPVGFKVGLDRLYLTNTNGDLIVINLTSGKFEKKIKIARGSILPPYIFNQHLYLIKNGNIIKYD